MTSVLSQLSTLLIAGSAGELASPPEGYYPFDVAPFKTPPKVRKPPYLQTSKPCPGEFRLVRQTNR